MPPLFSMKYLLIYFLQQSNISREMITVTVIICCAIPGSFRITFEFTRLLYKEFFIENMDEAERTANLKRIAVYCQKDVITTGNIILRFKNMPPVNPDDIKIVE